jgi:hypothetical protein
VRGPQYAWANARRLQAPLADAHIGYEHRPELAPTTELRHLQYWADARQDVGKRSRVRLSPEYIRGYTQEILDRAPLEALVERLPVHGIAALLCVEATAQITIASSRLAPSHIGPALPLRAARIVPSMNGTIAQKCRVSDSNWSSHEPRFAGRGARCRRRSDARSLAPAQASCPLPLSMPRGTLRPARRACPIGLCGTSLASGAPAVVTAAARPNASRHVRVSKRSAGGFAESRPLAVAGDRRPPANDRRHLRRARFRPQVAVPVAGAGRSLSTASARAPAWVGVIVSPRIRSRGRRRLASLLVLQADRAARRVARSSADEV